MSSKDYYKRPSGVVCEKRYCGREFQGGVMSAKEMGYMGSYGNRDSQLASRSVFTYGAWTISDGSFVPKCVSRNAGTKSLLGQKV